MIRKHQLQIIFLLTLFFPPVERVIWKKTPNNNKQNQKKKKKEKKRRKKKRKKKEVYPLAIFIYQKHRKEYYHANHISVISYISSFRSESVNL